MHIFVYMYEKLSWKWFRICFRFRVLTFPNMTMSDSSFFANSASILEMWTGWRVIMESAGTSTWIPLSAPIARAVRMVSWKQHTIMSFAIMILFLFFHHSRHRINTYAVVVKISIFLYLFHIISDIISRIGIFDMI